MKCVSRLVIFSFLLSSFLVAALQNYYGSNQPGYNISQYGNQHGNSQYPPYGNTQQTHPGNQGQFGNQGAFGGVGGHQWNQTRYDTPNTQTPPPWNQGSPSQPLGSWNHHNQSQYGGFQPSIPNQSRPGYPASGGPYPTANYPGGSGNPPYGGNKTFPLGGTGPYPYGGNRTHQSAGSGSFQPGGSGIYPAGGSVSYPQRGSGTYPSGVNATYPPYTPGRDYPHNNGGTYPLIGPGGPSSSPPGTYPAGSHVSGYPSGGSTNYPGPGSSNYPGSGSNYPAPGSGSNYPSPSSGSSYPSPGSGSSYPSPGSGSSYPSPGSAGQYPSSGSSGSYPSAGTGSNYPSSGSGLYPSLERPNPNQGQQFGSQAGQQSQQFLNCLSSCDRGTDSTPICGTNKQTYPNLKALQCEQKCGAAVTYKHYGVCT